MLRWFCLILGLWLGQSATWAQQPQIAPLNPEFEKHLAQSRMALAPDALTSGHGFGLVPNPVDLSYLSTQSVLPRAVQSASVPLPAIYDLRALGRVTPVRDQGAYGTCWAFATYGSLESCLMPLEASNFSENNLANLHGFDLGFDAGGNAFMSMAYLTRWGGPLNEQEDPYPNPGGSLTKLPACKHAHQVYILPAKTSATDNDAIKQAVMNFGGVYVSMYASSDLGSPVSGTCYDATYKSYCYPQTQPPRNHAVTVVGWDDNFDKSKFPSAPAGNGAYLAKNSWGTSFGDAGYFYISYYDAQFGWAPMFVFLDAESTANYTRIYEYDPFGWVNSIGTGLATTFFGANIYTAAATERIGAVGFYATTANTTYEADVYVGVVNGFPSSGGLVARATGTCTYSGYYTAPFPAPALVAAGQQFSIVLRLTTPGNVYPQAIQCAVAGYSSGATSTPGRSYFSKDGATWTDLYPWNPTATLCIKAYAFSVPDLVNSSLSVAPVSGSDTAPHLAVQFWRYRNVPSAVIQYEQSSTLAPGSWQSLTPGADIVETILQTDGTREQVQAICSKNISQTGGRSFVRVKVAR